MKNTNNGGKIQVCTVAVEEHRQRRKEGTYSYTATAPGYPPLAGIADTTTVRHRMEMLFNREVAVA